MTAPANFFETRVHGVAAFASATVWRAGWGGSIRTVPTIDGDRATVSVELLDDTTPDPPERVSDEVRARFAEGVRLAAKTMGLVLVEITATSYTLRCRTQEDRDQERQDRALVELAKRAAHDEATPRAVSTAKLRSLRSDDVEVPRDWTAFSHLEQCAGIAEALDVLRLALEPGIGTAEGQTLAAQTVVRIARSSPRRDVRLRAAQRLRELGRVQEAEQLDGEPRTRRP